MPVVPGVNERSVVIDPVKTPTFTPMMPDGAFGAGVVKSAEGLGKEIANIPTVVDKTIDKVNARDAMDDAIRQANKESLKQPTWSPAAANDDIRLDLGKFAPHVADALDLTNMFNQQGQDLQSSFFNLDGKDAVNGLPDALQTVDKLQSDAVSSATPEASALAGPAIGTWADSLKESLQRHAQSQQKVYDDTLDQTQIDQGQKSVGLLYNDDNNFLMNLHAGATASADQAVRALLASNPNATADDIASVADTARRATASDYTAARVTAALDQNDLPTAQRLFGRWSGDLSPADAQEIAGHLQAATFNKDSQDQTSNILAVYHPATGVSPWADQQRNVDDVIKKNGAQTSTTRQHTQTLSGADAVGQASNSQSQPASDDQTGKSSDTSGAGDDVHLDFPEGGAKPHYPGERLVMAVNADRSTPEKRKQADDAIRKAELAVKNLPREKFPMQWPVDVEHRVNHHHGDTGEGWFGFVRTDGTLAHDGFDMTAPEGTPVKAAAAGKITLAAMEPSGTYGYQIIIDHGNGFYTQYAHLNASMEKDSQGKRVFVFHDANGQRVELKQGQEVAAGDQIGVVGITGNPPKVNGKLSPTGTAHVHFELRYGNDGQDPATRVTVNPGFYLPQDYQ